jgi:hypothetical protein
MVYIISWRRSSRVQSLAQEYMSGITGSRMGMNFWKVTLQNEVNVQDVVHSNHHMVEDGRENQYFSW